MSSPVLFNVYTYGARYKNTTVAVFADNIALYSSSMSTKRALRQAVSACHQNSYKLRKPKITVNAVSRPAVMEEVPRTKTQAEISEDVDRLTEWLSKQPHLPKDVDKELLAAYIHGTKSLEIAKQKLDALYSSKAKAPHLFTFAARDPLDEAFKEASGSVKVFFLPKLTAEGYLVLVITFDLDFSKFDYIQYVVRLMMMVELAMLRWPNMAGLVLVSDIGGMDSSLLSKYDLTTGIYIIHWFQSAIPIKLKRGVTFKTPKFFETIINLLFKVFMSKKIFDRLVFTSDDINTMKKYVDEDLLPSDYGGKEDTSDNLNNYWMEELVNKRDWFMKTSKQVVDEAKRPPDQDNTYGTEGTFRNLNMD